MEVFHWVPGLTHVVVAAVLAPIAHVDRLVRSLQLAPLVGTTSSG